MPNKPLTEAYKQATHIRHSFEKKAQAYRVEMNEISRQHKEIRNFCHMVSAELYHEGDFYGMTIEPFSSTDGFRANPRYVLPILRYGFNNDHAIHFRKTNKSGLEGAMHITLHKSRFNTIGHHFFAKKQDENWTYYKAMNSSGLGLNEIDLHKMVELLLIRFFDSAKIDFVTSTAM